jgi:argininosuccinate lyase
MAKIWQKNTIEKNEIANLVEQFTVGKDRELDLVLAKFDVLGSLAHTQMLSEVRLMEKEEFPIIRKELIKIYNLIINNNFSLDKNSEDIHSEIEYRLTQSIGEVGKKIHAGRSRNDQVLVDIKLYSRTKIKEIVEQTQILFDTLIELTATHKNTMLPGYTHLQIAMPSSFGLWFSAYAESLSDDMESLYAAYKLVNKNPLGSGAGYGSSFPLNRRRTTELLGFDDLNYNVVYAQMNRGKMEKIVSNAISNIASTLSKLAMDATLYINQNFGFISFPDVLTTGSSIMPHKKNPDVFELIRAKSNKLISLPNQIANITNNLPSGYHRDLQIIKEDYLNSFDTLIDCIKMSNLMLNHIQIKENILEKEQYKYLFTVDSINELVNQGKTFRDAYIEIGKQVENGTYQKPKELKHTLEGSMGNLCIEEITKQMLINTSKFQFNLWLEKENLLIS